MHAALELWESFLIAFSALLPLINPLGSALVFLGLVGEASPQTYRLLARKIAINTVFFVVVIGVLGTAILHFFGISLPIVQVSGGLVIATMGWSVLNEKDSSGKTPDKGAGVTVSPDATEEQLLQKAFYPFTFPVTAGPGTLVVTLTLAARAEGRGVTHMLLRHGGGLLAVFLLSALVYVCYANAPRLKNAVSHTTANGILRVVAFILLCIGVQIFWNGFSDLLGPLLARR